MFEHGTATPIPLDVTTLFIVSTCVTALLGLNAQEVSRRPPARERASARDANPVVKRARKLQR